MTFVNEHISDADKARIDFSKIIHPVYSRAPIDPDEWTVDHERNIALIYLGGGGLERPYYFLMYWQGQVLTIFLNATRIGNFTTNDLEVTWDIYALQLPKNVSREQLLVTLKDAVFTFGFSNIKNRDKVKAVHFTF